MLGKVVIIASICFLLAWLPDKYGQKVWGLLCRLGERTKRRRERGFLARGHALQRAMGEEGTEREIPSYKFYTELFIVLLQYHRTYGSPLREPLQGLQEHLSRDIQFERRVQGIRRESVAQFILMSGIIWFFTLVVGQTFELPRNLGVDGCVAALQGGGWLSFYFLDEILKKIHLKWFEGVARPLYSFDTLLKTGLSCGEMIKISCIGEALDIFEKRFPHHHLRLEGMLMKWREKGAPLSSEWKLFLQEVWSLVEDKCQTYAKCLQVVKFVILVLFFLSSYFVYLSSLFEGFF